MEEIILWKAGNPKSGWLFFEAPKFGQCEIQLYGYSTNDKISNEHGSS